MVDFENSILEAFETLKEIENVSTLNSDQQKEYGLELYKVIWKVDTEVRNLNGSFLSVSLLVCLLNDFPLSFPRIYLSKKDHDELKFIPHVDSTGFICCFNSEVSRTDPKQPKNIIKLCLARAKKIIEEGIRKANNKDFENEFIAYWERAFSKKDNINNDTLCLIDPQQITNNIYILELKTRINKYNYVIHCNDAHSQNFKIYLKDIGIEYTEAPAYYCSANSFNYTPPFDLTNAQTLTIINNSNNHSSIAFKKFINTKDFPKFVLCSLTIEKSSAFIGWMYKNPNKNRNGFRPNSVDNFTATFSLDSGERVVRKKIDILTKSRLTKRTVGETHPTTQTFLLAGLGSIGSNLTYFLNNLNKPNFRLVDYDTLEIENIERHLLGFNYIGMEKVDAVKTYLQSSNPLSEILVKKDSIVNTLTQTPSFVNDADYIFCSTGKTNIENWIGEKLTNGAIKKPVFFLWVEPHLAGGHCLFLPPNTKPYTSYFSDTLLSKYNVISSQYYNCPNNGLTLRESGCQTTYIPYSANNLIAFLSSIYPKIADIIESKSQVPKYFVWIGNLNYLQSKQIGLSDFATNKKTSQLIEI